MIGIGTMVHYFKQVTPTSGPATAAHGEIQIHAALVINTHPDGTLTLKVTDHDGGTYIVRRAREDTGKDGTWARIRVRP